MKLIWMDLPKKLSLTELQIVRQAERNLKENQSDWKMSLINRKNWKLFNQILNKKKGDSVMMI